MENGDKIEIEVAYARPDVQTILPVKIDRHMTIEEAIRHSGILEEFPEIDLATNKVGVFGKLAKLSATLQPGDRIEIYRVLIADPKDVRRQRAADGKKMKKGGGALDDGVE
ncbi:MAG: RnfH family protein [Gammaproteobacteria bacterium]|nr:RnfH family protein [Gammaproteobacteria bacterium]